MRDLIASGNRPEFLPGPRLRASSSLTVTMAGLRSLVCFVLGLGFLSHVMAFDNTRKDNVRTSDCNTMFAN